MEDVRIFKGGGVCLCWLTSGGMQDQGGSYLARHSVADGHNGILSQLKQADDFTRHHVQGEFGHCCNTFGLHLCQTLAHCGGHTNTYI